MLGVCSYLQWSAICCCNLLLRFVAGNGLCAAAWLAQAQAARALVGLVLGLSAVFVPRNAAVCAAFCAAICAAFCLCGQIASPSHSSVVFATIILLFITGSPQRKWLRSRQRNGCKWRFRVCDVKLLCLRRLAALARACVRACLLACALRHLQLEQFACFAPCQHFLLQQVARLRKGVCPILGHSEHKTRLASRSFRGNALQKHARCLRLAPRMAQDDGQAQSQ